jgi:hypothetical protein
MKIEEAYMSQEQKKVMVPKIKDLCKEYGVKGTLRVRHHSSIVLTIREGKIDFMGEYGTENERHQAGVESDRQRGYIQVNTYHFKNHFIGKSLEFLTKAFDILDMGNWDKSDIQTDYFNVGWYVDINIGEWNKPYVYTGNKDDKGDMMTLSKEDIQKYGTEDEKKILKETGEMGQHDIEEGGEFYEAAQTLKKAAQHISKLSRGLLKFKKVYPFDKYQGPYAQCAIYSGKSGFNTWARLWFAHGGGEEPGYYFLETGYQPIDDELFDISGDVYEIAKLVRKLVKEKLGISEARRPDIDYSEKKGVVTADITETPDERKMRILTNKWQRFETSMRILKTHLEGTKTEIKTNIKDIVDATDLLNTVKVEAGKFIVTMDKQVEKTTESKDKFYDYLAKALNMSIEAVQALETSLTERIGTGDMKEPALRYTPKMESVLSTIKSAFYNMFVKKYINPIKDILAMIGEGGEAEGSYQNLKMEDVDKYATEDEKKILEGHMHQMEWASLPDRMVGLDAHLTGNFYPPHPGWVKRRIKDAFKKYYDGKLNIEGVIRNLTKGTRDPKFSKEERGPIMRDSDAVYRYFGEFFNSEDIEEY